MSKYYEIPTFEEDTKIFSDIMKNRVKCPICGHSITIMKNDRDICNVCYHWVYKTKKAEFKYKLKERLIRRKYDNKNNTKRYSN